MMFGYGGGSAVLMVVGMLVFLGLLIWAVYAFMGGDSRRAFGRGSRTSSATAREILDGRLARGEINTDEHRHQVDTIGAGAEQR
jgi:uncharacterized membrane protein